MSSESIARRLLSYTVIPPELYVEREADRQLLANLKQMERPAYVLVARQMGKTNLLLHAKREIESPQHRVVYVDLSTAFDDERECFRRIIDCALDSFPIEFAPAIASIEAARSQARPPAREHEVELRALLKVFGGKLIIVLDEIDSLTNAPFSDRVFAHIRSIYFARTSISEFKRLTYVLSGVVEPNDIIKDKKISPFNIGEKIYLDDFTPMELDQFLSNAGLDFNTSIRQRIFYWTGGNPRMTWDLCSEVAATSSGNGNILVSNVDECVQKLYLNDFLHTPVDHIRHLVSENSDLRSAVWELAHANLAKINSQDRSKLFLAGITKSIAQSELPSFKNEVIKRALDIRWLEEVVLGERAILDMAEQKYFKGDYVGASVLFEKYLAMVGVDSCSVTNLTWYAIGETATLQGNLTKAAECYDKAYSLTPSEDAFRFQIRFSQGSAALKRKDFESALEYFDVFTIEGGSTETDLKALINLMGVHIRIGDENNFRKIEAIYQNFENRLQGCATCGVSESSKNGIHGMALFNLGEALIKLDRKKEAFDVFDRAFNLVSYECQPVVLLKKAGVAPDISQRQEIILSLASCLIAQPIEISSRDVDNPLSFDKGIACQLIAELADLNLDEALEQFFVTLKKDTENSISFTSSSLLVDSGRWLVGLKKHDSAAKLFERALAEAGPNHIERLEAYRWLVWAAKTEDKFLEYIELFKVPGVVDTFTVIDMNNFSTFASKFMMSHNWKSALSVVVTADIYREKTEAKLRRNFVAFDSLKLICWDNLGIEPAVKAAAHKASKFLDELPAVRGDDDLIFFSPSDIAAAINITRSYARAYISPEITIKSGQKKISRNTKISVRYLDGKLLRDVKFKNVEIDINAGRCVVIDDV